MDKVVIKSKYNEKFHSGFYKFHMFRKSASIYFFLLALAFSIYLAVQTSLDPKSDPNEILISWGLTILLLGAIPIFTFGKVRAIVRQTKKDRGDNIEIIEITKYKIVRKIEGDSGKIVLGWEDFESVYEVEKCFYMYIDKDRGLVIPKEDIIDGNVEVLRKLVTNNLKPNRKGKSKYKKMYKG